MKYPFNIFVISNQLSFGKRKEQRCYRSFAKETGKCFESFEMKIFFFLLVKNFFFTPKRWDESESRQTFHSELFMNINRQFSIKRIFFQTFDNRLLLPALSENFPCSKIFPSCFSQEKGKLSMSCQKREKFIFHHHTRCVCWRTSR